MPERTSLQVETVKLIARVQGYLLAAIPYLETHVSQFIAQAQGPAASPSSSTHADDSPAAASSSSSVTPAALAAQHQQRYTSSRVAELLDSVLPPPISARDAAKLGKRETTSVAKNEGPAPGLPSILYPSSIPSLPLPPGAGFEYPPTFPQPAELPDPFVYTPAHAGPSNFPLALQTLAEAAVPDAAAANAFLGGTGKGKGREVVLATDDPALPDGIARSALLDLYFNQVVQPVLPMLVRSTVALCFVASLLTSLLTQDKSRFLRWSAHLPVHQPPPDSSASLIPPALYYAVFALASSYIPPSSPLAASLPSNAADTYARAAQTHLVRDVFLDETATSAAGLSVENAQSAAILAIVDWGAGQLDRAWMMSGALRLSFSSVMSR